MRPLPEGPSLHGACARASGARSLEHLHRELEEESSLLLLSEGLVYETTLTLSPQVQLATPGPSSLSKPPPKGAPLKIFLSCKYQLLNSVEQTTTEPLVWARCCPKS